LAPAFSQSTAVYDNPEEDYRTGTDLFHKEKYGAAQEKFNKVILETDNPFSPLRINAEYYEAICALELYNRDAAFKLDEFVRNHPTSSYINRVNFQLGRLSYRDRKYRKAMESFQAVDISELSADERAEYHFKLGYCLFKRKEFASSRLSFNKVVNSNSKYASPSSYFLAHMDYADGNYNSALDRFTELFDDPNFKAIAPFYVVQIHYMQRNYDEVIKTAPPLMVNATNKRAAELTKVLGESYYYKNKYDKALPYLEQYHQSSRTGLDRNDNYIMGYSLYKTGDYEGAARYFQRSTGQKDTIAQYAWYYLAACYLEQGQKKFAANAFTQSYKLSFDRDVREDALFNHAQLAFELSYDPYNEAVKALRSYLKAYPDSKRNDEAYNFLFKISMTTRNFKDAQEALENIQVKGVDYKKNFQKITFYTGIELFNQFDYEKAAEMFKKSVEYNEDKQITAESIFWLAETFYRQENFWGAKKYYLEFLSAPKAKKVPVYNMANYNLGYVYFNRKEYNGGIYYFKSFIANLSDEQPVMVADAFLRMGDSWFISKGYDDAIAYYDKAINLNSIDVDYALLQKSKALGVLQRYPEKIQTLNRLGTNFPNSSYISEVYYELGNTYLQNRDNEKALVNFKKVAADYPKSVFAVKSRLKAGLIYYNNELSDLAIQTFKGVVEDFPGTAESKEALASLQNLYIEQGRANDYIEYTKTLSFASISISEQDSLIYTSAENQYMEGHYDIAALSLDNYIKKFPEGAFLLSANFYLAECLIKQDKKEEALGGYEYVISKPKSVFTESALLKAADLSYSLEKFDNALSYFKTLEQTAEIKSNIPESWYGQMKCSFLLGNYQDVVSSSEKLLKAEKISDEMKLEALMLSAKSLYKNDEPLLSKSRFREVVEFSQGAAGAEAKYTIARIEFELNDLETAEKTVFDLINKYAPYDYWVASGFILLADIYQSTENVFQAKQTLQSVIDNHEGEELRNLAIQKLDALIAAEGQDEVVEDDGEAETIQLDGEEVELQNY